MRAKLANLNNCAVPFLAAPPPICAGTTIITPKIELNLFICNHQPMPLLYSETEIGNKAPNIRHVEVIVRCNW